MRCHVGILVRSVTSEKGGANCTFVTYFRPGLGFVAKVEVARRLFVSALAAAIANRRQPE